MTNKCNATTEPRPIAEQARSSGPPSFVSGNTPPDAGPATDFTANPTWRPPSTPPTDEESQAEYTRRGKASTKAKDVTTSIPPKTPPGNTAPSGADIEAAKANGVQMHLVPTAQHDITRSMLAGPSKLDSFGKLVLRCVVNNRQFAELAGQIVNVDAKTGKGELNDFLNPVYGLAFAAMQAFMKAASPGAPRPTSGPEWMTAIRPHLQHFLSKTPDFPLSYEQDIEELLKGLSSLDYGELDRVCDGLVDYIRGVRLLQTETQTTMVDPATKMARLNEIESSIRVPCSSNRWQGLSNLGEVEATPFLIDNLLVEGTVAMIFGPPGDGKTFLALDLGSSVASGRAWNGLHTEQGGVLYYCLEGGVGFRNRMRALRQKGLLHDKDPFEFSTESINLRSPDAQTRIVNDIKVNERKFNTKVKLIVIDTLAVATSGGNECASDDMGAALAAISEVVKSSGVTALLLHHPGKDVSKGPRGWSGIVGNLDTIIEMERSSNGVRKAKVTKQKDGEEGHDYTFELEVVRLGCDESLRPVTSCIVRHLSTEEVAKASGDDHEGILCRLWADRSADLVINTGIVCKLLGITAKGGAGTTQVQKIMGKLDNVGLVAEAARGPQNTHQWRPTQKGKEVLLRNRQCPDADSTD